MKANWKKIKLTDEVMNDLSNWEQYQVDFLRELDDDKDNDLDSFFVLSLWIAIKPNYDPAQTQLDEFIKFLQNIKKPTTYTYHGSQSFPEQPAFLKSYRFSEISVV